MGSNGENFLIDIRKELKEVTDETNLKFTSIMLDAHSLAQDLTPVKTGFARNNWYLSNSRPVGPEVKNPGAGNFSAYGTGVSQGVKFELGETVFLINNTEYISHLDLGTMNTYPIGISHQVQILIERRIARLK